MQDSHRGNTASVDAASVDTASEMSRWAVGRRRVGRGTPAGAGTLVFSSGRVTLLLAMVFAAFDGVATYLHLSFGTAVEGNLVVASMIDLWGADTGLLIRTGEVLVLIAVLGWLAGRSRSARHGLTGVTTVLGAVAVYHLAGPTLAGM